MIKSFWEEIRKEKIRNNKGKMSIWRIYMSGSTRVHKCSCHHYMPEYGSEWWTLHIYACVCICEECERCLLIVLSVMKMIEVDFVVPWIFYSFNDVFVSSYSFKVFWDLIGLLSNYHNMPPQAQHIPIRCRRCWCLHGDNGFVRISAGLFIVGMWCSTMLPAIISFLV